MASGAGMKFSGKGHNESTKNVFDDMVVASNKTCATNLKTHLSLLSTKPTQQITTLTNTRAPCHTPHQHNTNIFLIFLSKLITNINYMEKRWIRKQYFKQLLTMKRIISLSVLIIWQHGRF